MKPESDITLVLMRYASRLPIDTNDRYARKACGTIVYKLRDEKSVKLFPDREHLSRAIDPGVNAADLFIVSNRGRTHTRSRLSRLTYSSPRRSRACGMERRST